MSCRVIAALLVSWLIASGASAQDVPPAPSAYAAASVGVDLVLEPLVAAAEADLARGALPMALGRTQVVIAETPASSSMHVRAEGASLLARQRLGATPPGSVSTDDAYAPMADAAIADTAAGRFDLARARLAWLDAHVPAGSALAIRSATAHAALDARATSAPATAVRTPTTWTAPAPPTTPAHPSDPRRRTDLEIVDLYITTGLAGSYLGAWIAQGPGWLDGNPDAGRLSAIAMLVGAGVLTLGVFGYDQIDQGPRRGQPGAIAEGIRYGFVLSGLTLGVLSADHSYRVGEMFDAMGIGVLGGAALGTIFAYALEPHPSQVQFTQATGVWGGVLGAELAALVTPLAFPSFGAGVERTQTGFGLTLGGLSAGLLAGLVLSAAHENFSARRSWLTTAGLVAGSGTGTLVWLLISAGERYQFDVPTWGACAGIGGIAGLIVGAVLSSGDHDPRNWDEVPEVQVSVAPTTGGASLGLSGTF